MRAFFAKLGDAIVSGVKTIGRYFKGAALMGWHVCTWGWNFTGTYISTAWSDAKTTWNSGHGFRAVLGFFLSMLAVPFIIDLWVAAAILVWGTGLVLIPLFIINFALTLGGVLLMALLTFAVLCLFSWLGGLCFTTDQKPIEVATQSPSAPEAVPAA